jgi:hypothetical protein
MDIRNLGLGRKSQSDREDVITLKQERCSSESEHPTVVPRGTYLIRDRESSVVWRTRQGTDSPIDKSPSGSFDW